MKYQTFSKFSEIHNYMAKHQKIYLFLGEGIHKIKQQSEQMACKEAIQHLKAYSDFQDITGKIQQKHNAYD